MADREHRSKVMYWWNIGMFQLCGDLASSMKRAVALLSPCEALPSWPHFFGYYSIVVSLFPILGQNSVHDVLFLLTFTVETVSLGAVVSFLMPPVEDRSLVDER